MPLNKSLKTKGKRPMTDAQVDQWEASRDLEAELVESVRQMQRGEGHGGVLASNRRAAKLRLVAGTVCAVARGIGAYLAGLGAGSQTAIRRSAHTNHIGAAQPASPARSGERLRRPLSVPAELDQVPLSALQHWRYCPRQCGLIHLEQVFDDNVHTLRGQAVHAKVDKPGVETDRPAFMPGAD